MELDRALQILRSLGDGVDPLTGEIFHPDSAYQHADTVRALSIAVRAIEMQMESNGRRRSLPMQAGKAWSEEEDEALMKAFDEGTKTNQMAAAHSRTSGAIHARLVKLGKIPPTAARPKSNS